MQADLTPFKEANRLNQHPPDFTSGKQKRKVYVDVCSAHRKDEAKNEASGFYRPLVNITPICQSSL